MKNKVTLNSPSAKQMLYMALALLTIYLIDYREFFISGIKAGLGEFNFL